MSNLSDNAIDVMNRHVYDTTVPNSPADLVSYHPDGGDAATYPAIVGDEETEERSTGRETNKITICRARFRTSDVPDPQVDSDTAELEAGVLYVLDRIEERSAADWQGVFRRVRRTSRQAGDAAREVR